MTFLSPHRKFRNRSTEGVFSLAFAVDNTCGRPILEPRVNGLTAAPAGTRTRRQTSINL
jgi:hypothetical protein